MQTLDEIAPAFVEMAHRIVWATVATVSPTGAPHTRILHPMWEWDGLALTGWIATSPQSPKRRDLDHRPSVSLTYWTPAHDTCTADCEITWILDPEAKRALWNRFVDVPILTQSNI
jgi:general stress protein 26